MPQIAGTNSVKFGGGTKTVGELAACVSLRLAELGSCRAPLALVSENTVELAGAAAWLAQSETDGMILPRERLTAPLRGALLESGYAIADLAQGRLDAGPQRGVPQPGRVTLATSGTTGAPRLVEHSWKTLFTMTRLREAQPLNWLLTYQPGTYAWYQVLVLALFIPGQSLTVSQERSPQALIEEALEHGVEAISATPTFWRLALLESPRELLRKLALRQITLGGERVDQDILDHLHALYPSARLTHIYASSEAGACIVVGDGREGFPAAWLTSADAPDPLPGGRPLLRIRDGTLWIGSPHAALRQRGWIASGDAVEIRGDRVLILGRADQSIINVGGTKVAARDVESCLLRHPRIAWCRVWGRKAPLVGQLVVCDVVFRSAEETLSDRELAQFCAPALPDYMIPRIWTRLDRIPTTENLKTELA